MLAQSEKSKNEINQQLKQTQDQLETVEEENDELVLEIRKWKWKRRIISYKKNL